MDGKTAWQQADIVLDRLLDRPPEERRAALDAMQLAPDVRAVAERLLAAHELGSDILDEPLQTGAAPFGDDAMTGRRFGAWVIEREIGRGGMAVVYRAHHQQQPERVAALKLMTLGALAGAGIDHFRREQSILARLSHPHIVPLFDAGVAEDGTPWLTMALVDGERIDRWCRTHALDARARVRLFLPVCDAVNYAHQNLVVHRDLKPSNVLVDTTGQVRLLDFGIARLADDSGESTASAYRALTPGYAAPEQFEGRPAATTMDVYGLGALLHAMLTGSPPAPRTASDAAARPPAATGTDEVRVPMNSDMVAILQRALAAEPASRYGSVAAFRADIEAWLEDRPVVARRASLAYRARKFATRHRLGFGVSALLLLSLIAGATATYWQYQRALAAAALASEQAQRATAVKDFLVGLFNAPDPEQAGGAVDTKTMFRRGVEQLRNIETIDPGARIDLLNTIADVQFTMTWYDDAAATYDVAIALGRAHADASTIGLADALYSRAMLRRETNRLDDSERDFSEALGLLHSRDTPESRNHQIRLLVQWSLLDSARQQPTRALERLDQAERLAQGATDLPERSAINLQTTRGSIYYELGRYEEALVPLRKALELQRKAGNAGDASISLTLGWLASVSAVLNRTEDALAYDREGVAVARAAYPAGHPEIGAALYSYGDSLRQAGRFEEAVKQFDEAIDIQSKSSGRRGTLVLTQLARTRALVALGRYADVAQEALRVRPALEAELGSGSMAAVQLTEQELVSLAALDHADLDRTIARARAQLDGLSADLIAQPVAQSLRWCVADVLLERHRDSESASWRAELEQRAANAPDNPGMRVRIAGLQLRAALHTPRDEAIAAQANALATTLEEATAASTESRVYAWLAVADAAAARGDQTLRAKSIEALHALQAVHPLPLALARRIEVTESKP